jgi:DNA-binding beta-propeller fold protein YncE
MFAVTRAVPLRHWLKSATILAGCLAGPAAQSQTIQGTIVPSGQTITPTAAAHAVFQDLNPMLVDHPNYRAGQALKTAISPDGTTLLVMTSGYNNLNESANVNASDYSYLEPSASQEYVFVYDISGANAATPAVKQVIKIDDTFEGLVFSPDGTKFYASGGVDDKIYTFTNSSSGWTQTAIVHLGHKIQKAADGFGNGGIGFLQSPSAAGLALSASGNLLVVANIYNESISVINTQTDKVEYEYDLRPYNTTPSTGEGQPGGETPFAVAVAGESTVYVSSIRDRQVVVLDISSGTPKLVTRIGLTGNPNSMIFDNPASPTKLYVAQDNSDYVAVINLADNTIIEQIDTIGPAGITPSTERYTGAAPNNLAITPNGRTLYVTNGGQNAVAVIPLAGPAPHATAGLIPTGWYPHAVSVSANGRYLYVTNGKSDPGPNIAYCSSSTYDLKGYTYPGGNSNYNNQCYASNEYDFQIEKAGLLALPVPASAELATLTSQVAANNLYNKKETVSAAQTMAALQQKITHVIYIVKENRTFDQVLGDLTNGANGDPSLTVFGRRVTPNFHAFSNNFVTLDNFYDPAEVSGNGWEWSTAARETDLNVKQIPLDYASSPAPSPLNQGYRGAPYNAEGQNNDVDVGIATTAEREVAEPLYGDITKAFPGGTANFFPGTNNDAAPDGPDDGDKQTGYLWDAAVRAGLTVRNYGYYIDLIPYSLPAGTPGYIPPTDSTPYANNDVQAYSTNPTLRGLTDPYFRSFDNNYPDFWRYNEWKREFDNFVTNGDLPNLTFLRFMHDHMGDFHSAQGGINTPEAQQADDDYAVGLVADAVAHSKYRGNTLIFVVEDDAQDGPDHVDAHRSTAYIVGPYVKQKAVVSTFYTTVNMIRTIEDILGTDHLNLNDAYAAPMADVFDLNQATWTYRAAASPYLRGTADAVAGTHFSDNDVANPVHLASWWADQTKGFDWSREDRAPADLFNRVIWKGFNGDKPFPAIRHGASKVSVVGDHDD